MTSLSSAAPAGQDVADTSRARASTSGSQGRMSTSPFLLELQDGDAVPSDQGAQEQDRPDDDRQNDRAQRARHPRVAVLDLVEAGHGPEVEPWRGEEDHGADGDHPREEELAEERERGGRQERQR